MAEKPATRRCLRQPEAQTRCFCANRAAVVMVATIAIQSAMLLLALTRAKQRAYAIRCMNYSRQSMPAWVHYADDKQCPPGWQQTKEFQKSILGTESK